jgi:hypothetical protein
MVVDGFPSDAQIVSSLGHILSREDDLNEGEGNYRNEYAQARTEPSKDFSPSLGCSRDRRR